MRGNVLFIDPWKSNSSARNLIWARKLQNRFLQFLSNLISRAQNSNSAMLNTSKSSFSTQSFDFVLGWRIHRRAIYQYYGRCWSWRPPRKRWTHHYLFGWQKKTLFFNIFNTRFSYFQHLFTIFRVTTLIQKYNWNVFS